MYSIVRVKLFYKSTKNDVTLFLFYFSVLAFRIWIMSFAILFLGTLLVSVPVNWSFLYVPSNSCNISKPFLNHYLYSESQINENIARAHKMSSSKFILKCMTAVMLPHWSAQKESCLDVRSFKGLNTIYENISKYHCS